MQDTFYLNDSDKAAPSLHLTPIPSKKFLVDSIFTINQRSYYFREVKSLLYLILILNFRGDRDY